MTCFRPVTAYYSNEVNEKSGLRSLIFREEIGQSQNLEQLKIPCGKCSGCRLDKSRDWAVRVMHESSLYDKNCFITLTFNDENIKRSLDKSDFQKFMKRLRKKFGQGVRYFHCGEYGERLNRPHHHAILFNFDFTDKYLYKVSNNVKWYRSECLEKLWPFGFSVIGDVNFASAAYVARYVVKKQSKDFKGRMHYDGRVPEYITMSRRPGIASVWIDKYFTDVYPSDFVVLHGNVNLKAKPPKFYDEKLSLTSGKLYRIIKRVRREKAEQADDGVRRLKVKEYLKKEQLKRLERSYENVT